MIYDSKTAIELMEGRGYKNTATNGAKNVLFFLKKYDDKNILIHAAIRLEKQTIDLDSTGVLDLGISLEATSIPMESVKFEDFETKFYNYLYLCIYGKPVPSVENNTDNGLYFKTESKTVPGGKSVGGVETGKGKPVKPTIDERKKELWELIKQNGKIKGYEKEMCESFYRHWIEMNPGGKKMRFEMEKVFDVGKRLRTWFDNDKKWLPTWKQKQEQKVKIEQEQVTNTNKNIKKYKDLF
jgi:hypothetical protein